MMSVIVRSGNDYTLYAKGAPEIMILKCNLSTIEKNELLKINDSMARKGLRSLLIAEKKISKVEADLAVMEDKVAESELSFLGITAMQDPLRPEVKKAILEAKIAGIRTIMITGDHRETALTIAYEAGIIDEFDKVLSEKEVEKLTLPALTRQIQNGVNVFARISPLGKLKIINAIKKIPNTQVAVTGDGVNDAPALKASHIGIAMGKTGTDLTREVADMVITDDNYATIVEAVKEGRVIFANLVKFIRYLISCNISEVIVVTLGAIYGVPALALGMDPAEKDVMKRPPRDLSQGILHKKRLGYMMIEGIIIGLSVF